MKPQLTKKDKLISTDIGWAQQYDTSKLIRLRAGSVFGIHFQLPEMEQSKTISCLEGITFHACVEIVSGEVLQFELHESDQLFIPKEYAHGMFAIHDSRVHMHVDRPFSDHHHRGIRWNSLNLKWINGLDIYPENYLNEDNKWPDFEVARQEYTEWKLKKFTTNL